MIRGSDYGKVRIKDRILYFLFLFRYQDDSIAFIKSHRRAVLISLLASNYVYEGEAGGFVSFAGTIFLLCQIAVYGFALLAVQCNLWRKMRYVIAMFVLFLCIMLGTVRTYLRVLEYSIRIQVCNDIKFAKCEVVA